MSSKMFYLFNGIVEYVKANIRHNRNMSIKIINLLNSCVFLRCLETVGVCNSYRLVELEVIIQYSKIR